MSFNIVKICSESNILYMLVQIPTITALEWNLQGANLKKSGLVRREDDLHFQYLLYTYSKMSPPHVAIY